MKEYYSWTERQQKEAATSSLLQTPQAAGESDILLEWPEHSHILTMTIAEENLPVTKTVVQSRASAMERLNSPFGLV